MLRFKKYKKEKKSSDSTSTPLDMSTRFCRIKVIECRDLLSMDRNGFSDPFVTLTYAGDRSNRKVTDIQFKTLNPVYVDEEYTFPVQDPNLDTFHVLVMDYDRLGPNDFLGQVTLPIQGAVQLKGEPLDLWVDLKDKERRASRKSKKDFGKIHLSVTYLDADQKSDTAASLDQPVEGTPRWAIPYDDITLGKELGRGAFGVVYKGKWRLQDVAVKVIPPDKMGPKELAEFRAECELMMSLRPHRNVLTLLGVSMDPSKPVCLVTDFVDCGCLESKLHDPAFPLDWPLILKLTKGIVAAARNILLTGGMDALVSDFGLSKKVEDPSQLKQSVRESEFFRGPYKWMAPESLARNEFSAKSDVWSFGVTLWEILSRQLPFNHIDIYQAAEQIVHQHLRLPIAPHWPQKWKDLLVSCWRTNPDDRPDFPGIMALLDRIEHEDIAQLQATYAAAAQQPFVPNWSAPPQPHQVNSPSVNPYTPTGQAPPPQQASQGLGGSRS